MSTFTVYERLLFDEMFNIGETSMDNIKSLLHPDVYDFLHDKGNLNTIIDRKILREKNKDKPYDALILTKFLNSTFDAGKAIVELVNEITGRFLIYIDFHFLYLAPPKDSDKEDEDLVFQSASKASSCNATIKITDKQDIEDFSSEFESQTQTDILNTVFQHHVDLFNYENSGLRPYQLLSLVIHLQKFP